MTVPRSRGNNQSFRLNDFFSGTNLLLSFSQSNLIRHHPKLYLGSKLLRLLHHLDH